MCLTKKNSPVRGMQIMVAVTAVVFLQPGGVWQQMLADFSVRKHGSALSTQR